jgi:predicted dithiol-disulfide oxidoreductase (DUF899 family)
MGWTFPWASSFGSDFNADFHVSFTEEDQRVGVEYNYRREPALQPREGQQSAGEGAVAFAKMSGTDPATYTRERPRMSAFALENGVVYHAYSPPMRANWTVSGACTSGSTAPQRGATRQASGGAATTSTTRAERSRG